MIQLTRLNNKPLVVNSDLIKFVEQSPDTLVTLITGEKIVVLEPSGEVLARVVAFRRSVLQGLAQIWDPSSSHPSGAPPAGPPGPEQER
jgi:flagellar protein FlbD